jgi:hypothetical protein
VYFSIGAVQGRHIHTYPHTHTHTHTLVYIFVHWGAENYFTTRKSEARKILALYKDYLEQTRKVGDVFNDAKDLLGQEPVELSTVSLHTCPFVHYCMCVVCVHACVCNV